MKRAIHGKQELREIISIFPGSIDVFKKYGIDYERYCTEPLFDVVLMKGYSHLEIAEELNAKYEAATLLDGK